MRHKNHARATIDQRIDGIAQTFNAGRVTDGISPHRDIQIRPHQSNFSIEIKIIERLEHGIPFLIMLNFATLYPIAAQVKSITGAHLSQNSD